MNKTQAIAEAKQWLTQNARTPWAMMRLELMEEKDPSALDALTESNQLTEAVQQWETELTRMHMQLVQSGHYESPAEIGDVMRAELLEQYQNPWTVEELLEQALHEGKVLTEEQKQFLRENLPPALAQEVDLLP